MDAEQLAERQLSDEAVSGADPEKEGSVVVVVVAAEDEAIMAKSTLHTINNNKRSMQASSTPPSHNTIKVNNMAQARSTKFNRTTLPILSVSSVDHVY